jgi:HEAT repeat protein
VSHPLLAGFASEDREKRLRACRRAPADPSAVLLLDALAVALGDADEAVAWAASDALAEIGVRHDEVGERLRRAQRSAVPRVRRFASFARARLGHRDLALVPPLVEAFEAGSGPAYWRAGQLMVELDATLPEVRPLLTALAADDSKGSVRRMAIHCLRRLCADDPATVRALLRAAHDPDRDVRAAALTALADLPERSEELARLLAKAARSDPDSLCRALTRRPRETATDQNRR